MTRSNHPAVRVMVVMVIAVSVFSAGGCNRGRHRARAAIAVPEIAPADTLAVFNFRPKGDADARLYAVGFARALADRLYCAPTCLTQQPGANAIADHLYARKHPPEDPISDELAKAAGKSLGVRYVITGDLQLRGDELTISASLLDVSTSAQKPPMKVSGKLSDLPAMQVALVSQIVGAMKLQPSPAEEKEVRRANFSTPKTLALYARSSLTEDVKEAARYRWQAMEADPRSLFAAIRLLEYYVYGPATCVDIRNEKRLPEFLAASARRFPDNSHINFLAGWLLAKRFEYSKAEAQLRSVVRTDPKLGAAHHALAHLAIYRGNSELAAEEAHALVSLWPTSARARATLADACTSAARSARRGHFYAEMSTEIRKAWQENSEAAFREASTAVQLDRDHCNTWYIILTTGRELGRSTDVKKAFRELTRINPKHAGAYVEYAFCSSPQWGGAPGQQEEILSLADKAFGKGSGEACLVRAQVMLCNLNHEEQRSEILRLADEAVNKSKGTNQSALELKCRVLIGLRRRAEMLEIAEKGFRMNPSPGWRLLLARGYQFQYEDRGDRDALDKAANLLSVYVEEIPFDPGGHDLLGWCFSHQGKREAAKKEFLTALELDPNDKIAKEKLRYVQ